MIEAVSAPSSAPIPRQRELPKSAEASSWWITAGATGLALVGAGVGLVLGLSLP